MLIKFKSSDPRAGTVADLDSSLAQKFIDDGVATKVSAIAAANEEPEAAPAKASSSNKKPK